MTEKLRTGQELLEDLAEKYGVEFEVAESIVRDVLDAICDSLGIPRTEKFHLDIGKPYDE